MLSDSLNTTALTSQQLLPSQNTAFNPKNMSSSKLFFTSLGELKSAQTNASFERIISAQKITPFSTKKATAIVSPSRTHSNKEQNSSLLKSSLLDSSTSGNNVASTLTSQSTSPSTPPLSTPLMSQLNPPSVISSNWETSSASTTRSKSHLLTTLASIVISAAPVASPSSSASSSSKISTSQPSTLSTIPITL